MSMRMKFQAMKKTSKLLALGLVGILSMSTLLTGCGKEKKPEITMTDDDKVIRDTLLSSFDSMAESGNMKVNMANTYNLTMRTTMDGIQMDVNVNSDYTSNVVLLKGSGFGMSVENDYNIDVKTVSTSEDYGEKETNKSAFVTFYDEPNDTYYYTLGEEDDVTWYRSVWDGDQMARDFYDAIKNANINYTMETTDKEYKITFDYEILSETPEMESFFAKYKEVMNAIDEYMDILGNAKNGMATFIIQRDTNLLSDFTVSNIVLSNDDTKNMMGDDDMDGMVVGDMKMSAEIHVKFNSYGDVTSDDIDYYKNRITDSVDADEAIAEQEASKNDGSKSDGETIFYYEDENLTDKHNVSDYKLEDITNADLNNVRFLSDKDYEGLYIKPNRVTNYGWEYVAPEDDVENPPVVFTNVNYPDAMFTLLKRTDDETYSDMIDNGALGFEINVLNSAIAGTDMPDMEFTNYNIKFGMSEEDVLGKLGKPDVVYIGKYYNQYQYATYSISPIGEIDTVSVVFTFYHLDGIDGMYDVDMERYLGKVQPNVGNKDVENITDTENETTESED